MFYVINTMNPIAISKHRTRAAAEKAAEKYQKTVAKKHPGGYLKLEIYEGTDVTKRLDAILRGF